MGSNHHLDQKEKKQYYIKIENLPLGIRQDQVEKIIRNDLKKNVHDEYKIHYPLTTKIQNFLSRTVQTGVWECVIQMVEEEKVIDRNQVEIKDTESFGGKRNIRILVSFNYDMIRKKNQHPDLSSLILQLIKRKTLFYPR